MEPPVQLQHRHYEQPRLDTSDSTPAWRAPTLHELRRDDASPQTTQTASPIMSRRTSLDSDRFSTVSGLTSYFPNNPTNVNPQPAYVAPFGASQVVSEHQSSRRVSSDEEDDFKQNKDDVQFSEPALALVNAFLDQLLYSFLSTARSTSLHALRPAVTEVLKHKLAQQAIASAEEELAELLAGGDDEEEMDSKHKMAEEGRKWDLELVWKRTRLRVMVYMRLGEMEDEDEQRYVKEEELFHGSERRFSQSSGLVSWAAAIFLTSVLEYIAEQVMQVAGTAARTRARRQSRARRAAASMHARPYEHLVVEDHDVEKVALNSTLGRLWRTWRKALRNNASPGTPTHRSSASIGRASRDNMISAMSHHRSSFSTAHEGSAAGESRPMSRDQKDDLTEMDYPEHVLAANIPLPMGNSIRDIDEIVVPGLARDPDDEHEETDALDEPYAEHDLALLVPLPSFDDERDVDEIEVPGLARDPDAEDDDSKTVTSKDAVRRNSFAGTMSFRAFGGLPTPDDSSPSSPAERAMSPIGRQRSMSLPTPARTPLAMEDDEEEVAIADGVSEHVAEPAGSPPAVEGAQDEKSGTAFPWMVGRAAAATATAAGAWAMGSKMAESAPSKDTKEPFDVWSTPASQSTPRRGLGGLIQSASQENVIRDEQSAPNGLIDVKRDTSQQSFSDKDIEELDKRKSLLDIKSLMIVNSPSSAGSGRETPQKPQSPIRSESAYSTTPSGRDIGVSEEEGPDDAIGVARTADVPAPVTPRATEDIQEATGLSNRPPRLILDESRQTSDDPAVNHGQPLTPRTLKRQFLDLTEEAQAPDDNELSRSPPKQTQRASLSNGAQQSPSVGASPHRKSFTAPAEKNGAASHQKNQSGDSQVQDHPVIQRMASLKGSEPKSPKSPRSPKLVNESDVNIPLTSASIRGPEDFDMFVQGGDTLKYTLTPENVRYDPGPSNVEKAKNGGSPVEMDATSTRTGRSVVPKQPRSSAEDEESGSARRRSLSRPSTKNTSAHRKSGLMAREPRVLTESTRDFADFIRSTGPDKDTTVVPILANASTTSLHSLRSAHINGASASRSSSPGADRTRSLQRYSVDGNAVPPVPPVPARRKTTMQPRGPTTVGGGSAELIDFIRSGPDEAGKHRISRSVAPFRTTMDSDQLKDLGDKISTERSADLKVNTDAQSSSMVSSHRTSTNSRSALLSGPTASNQTSQPAYSGQPQKLSGSAKASQENDRKRFRNKDPYAMYDMNDDEDDENFLTSLPKSSRKEESMLDFLSSNEPPNSAPPQPLINPNSAQARAIIQNARANGIGSKSAPGGPETRTRSMPNSAGPRSGHASPLQSASSRQATTSSTNGRTRLQARGGAKDIASSSNTRELAEFFKSGPPEDADSLSAPAPIVGRDARASKELERAKKKAEKKKAGSGFFGRSRKKTYIDMP